MFRNVCMGALLALGLAAGCGPEPRFCDRCESKVRQENPDQRARLVPGQCEINGVPIDCRKYHPACPDCAKSK